MFCESDSSQNLLHYFSNKNIEEGTQKKAEVSVIYIIFITILDIFQIQSNLNGSNIFGTMEILSRHG